MSETAAETTDATAEGTEQTTSETDWKAEARKHEKAAKDLRAQLRDAAPQLAEFAKLKEASQTELERWQSFAKQHEERATKAEREAMVSRVALAKGLPVDLASRLQGDDEAALAADADVLLSLVPQPTGPRAPRPDASQGSSASGRAATSPGDQFASILQQQMGR